MIVNSLIAFLHFVAAFGITCMLFYEWLAFGESLTVTEARRIQLCDRWYGMFAGIILIAGFLRVYFFEKGQEFYFSNPFFLAKLGLFLIVGLLSIYPTIKFISWSNAIRAGQPPAIQAHEYKAISMILRVELILLTALVLCATLMAKGISF
jgi:putative membrane protein